MILSLVCLLNIVHQILKYHILLFHFQLFLVAFVLVLVLVFVLVVPIHVHFQLAKQVLKEHRHATKQYLQVQWTL